MRPRANFCAAFTASAYFSSARPDSAARPPISKAFWERVRTLLAKDVTVIGSYMCQGKMPQPVRDRYEAMEESPHRTSMLENFDRALSHPDADDLARLKAAVTK